MSENSKQRAAEKWGIAGEAGFQVLPDLLLKKQVELGLSATDMLVLINIAMHWWYADQRPFPRTSTIATRMGIETRTVQRSLRKLTDLGLVSRVKENVGTDEERTVCDLSGLVHRLGEYAHGDRDYQVRAFKQKEAANDARAV